MASPRFAHTPTLGPGLHRRVSNVGALPLAVSALALGVACQGSIATDTADAGNRDSNADGGGGSAATGHTSTATRATCGPTPTTLITASDLAVYGPEGISAGMDLAVNATDLYVAVNSNPDAVILRVPLQGGPVSMVASVQGNEQSLVLTDDYVVFAESHTTANNGWAGEIVRVGLDGSHRTVLFSANIVPSTIFGPAGTLATDGKNAYFAAQDGVRSVPLAGGPGKILTTHTGAMVLIGANVVIADSAAEGIFRVPAAGGPVTALVTGLTGNLGPVVACGSSICWASEVELSPSMAGTAALQELGSSGPPTILSQDPALYVVYRLVFDGTEFFATVLADISEGILARIPARGGSPVSGAFGSGLAVDDQCLYVADVAVGAFSVAKAEWDRSPLP